MMYKYRFYIGSIAGDVAKGTENEGRQFTKEEVKQAVEEHASFEGYTLFDGLGYWEGAEEASYVFEVLTQYQMHTAFIRLLKAELCQDSILYTVEKIEAFFA